MSTLINKSVYEGGGGVKNAPNSVYVVCTQSLIIVVTGSNSRIRYTEDCFSKYLQNFSMSLVKLYF